VTPSIRRLFASSALLSLAALSAGPSIASRVAHADEPRASQIAERLKAFGLDPAAAMEQLPPKRDFATGERAQPRARFSAEQIASRDFVTLKDQARQKQCTTVGDARVCLGELLPGRAPWQDNDRPEVLADNGASLVRSLEHMDKSGLSSARLAETPWSDHYWAFYSGELAYRYADKRLGKRSKNWLKYWTFAQEHDFIEIFKTGDLAQIELLSPSEKYDMLVGDMNGSLTAANWADGKSFYDSVGKVEDWMGLCHGWAVASYMIPRPAHAIDLVAADGGTMITFYPSDIKGLATQLWAKGQNNNRFAGGRCNDKRPRRARNGRLLSEECFDTNPGTWHLSVVNQIGVSQRSFVIDSTYDYEVWNQPVYSYQYSYFNPQTLEPVATLAEAAVKMGEFTQDRFGRFRSPDAVAVVGIAMDLAYVIETDPNHEKFDSPAKDKLQIVQYLYDLELDRDGEIIGGEWYESAHPDFLWTPAIGDLPTTPGDRLVQGHWRGTTPMPLTWHKAAVATSQGSGAPLARIVKILSELARE
jgi:hypothetical protein